MSEARTDPAVVTLRRWTRYGKDRAYATLDDLDLGYRDLVTGDVHCSVPTHTDTLTQATEHLWRQSRAARYEPRHAAVLAVSDQPSDADDETPPPFPAVSTTVAAAATMATAAVRARPSATVSRLPDRDLAQQRPGEAVHAKAKELRDAAPVRSRVARVLGTKTEERNWRIGGVAEEAVAKRLARLGPEWHVLHAIPVGNRGSDIDHLVIGPAGVFTVNAKNHPDSAIWVRGDTVKVNGVHQPYVRNSRYEAARAADLLTRRALFDVEVQGIVAIMGAEKGFTVVDQPSDGAVTLVTRKKIAELLRSRPAVLGAPSIARIYEVARHLATWQPATVEWSDDL